jgi:hypothetical protein
MKKPLLAFALLTTTLTASAGVIEVHNNSINGQTIKVELKGPSFPNWNPELLEVFTMQNGVQERSREFYPPQSVGHIIPVALKITDENGLALTDVCQIMFEQVKENPMNERIKVYTNGCGPEINVVKQANYSASLIYTGNKASQVTGD